MSRPIIMTICMFVLLLNFATGIISGLMGGVKNPWVRGPLMDTNTSYSDSFTSNFNGTLSPSGEMEDKTDLVDKILDVISWGFVSKIRTFFSDYAYGFINLFIAPIMGAMLLGVDGNPALYNTIIYGLNFFISVIYMMAIFWLFTGKKVWSG